MCACAVDQSDSVYLHPTLTSNGIALSYSQREMDG